MVTDDSDSTFDLDTYGGLALEPMVNGPTPR
jgi:hypothetical protein